jgi:hypothetical protein
MNSAALDAPGPTLRRLAEIENDLAIRQNSLEDAARKWFVLKRDRERDYAIEFMRAEGPVEARKSAALKVTSHIGALEEAEWESLKAVIRVLETRASIGQSILRSQAR